MTSTPAELPGFDFGSNPAASTIKIALLILFALVQIASASDRTDSNDNLERGQSSHCNILVSFS